MRIRTLAAGMACLLLSGAALASAWTFTEEVDPMSDKTRRYAETTSADGHRLRLYSQADGSLWGNFMLPDNGDTISPRQAPRYRVDDHKMVDLQLTMQIDRGSRRSGDRSYAWEPRWINWRMTGGDPRLAIETAPLLSGEKLLIQYYLGAGGHKYAEFSLDGAREPILRAAGVNVPSDPAAAARVEGGATAYMRKLTACAEKQGRGRLGCLEALFECRSLAVDEGETPERLDACLARAK